MCLALPVKIEEIQDESTALANIDGIKKAINVALIEDLQVGDFVIMHVGFALKKLDREEAEKTLALFSEIDSTIAKGA